MKTFLTNKKLELIVAELYIKGREINISLACFMQSYFSVKKDILNCTHCFIMKILDRQELQGIAVHHSSDMNFEGIMKPYRKCTKKQIDIDITLASGNFLCFRKN